MKVKEDDNNLDEEEVPNIVVEKIDVKNNNLNPDVSLF